MSELVEIITADGRFHISEADLEAYRVADDPDDEVEGFIKTPPDGPIPGSQMTWDVSPGKFLNLKVGQKPVVRTNSYVMFSGETMEGAPF